MSFSSGGSLMARCFALHPLNTSSPAPFGHPAWSYLDISYSFIRGYQVSKVTERLWVPEVSSFHCFLDSEYTIGTRNIRVNKLTALKATG